MLITRAPQAQAVEAVAESVCAHGVTNLVVDPVLVATSGDALAADGVARALVTRSARSRLRAGARARVARTRAELGACRGACHAEWPALALTRAGARAAQPVPAGGGGDAQPAGGLGAAGRAAHRLGGRHARRGARPARARAARRARQGRAPARRRRRCGTRRARRRGQRPALPPPRTHAGLSL